MAREDHPEVSAWVALDDLDFDWADALRIAGDPTVRRALTKCIQMLT